MKQYAKKLRINETSAEKKLWDEVLSNKKAGFKFRRQHPLNNYIVDFFCHQAGLIIEIDGGYHIYNSEEDFKRQRELEKLGFVVIRFENEEVLLDLERVRYEIIDLVFTLTEKRSA